MMGGKFKSYLLHDDPLANNAMLAAGILKVRLKDGLWERLIPDLVDAITELQAAGESLPPYAIEFMADSAKGKLKTGRGRRSFSTRKGLIRIHYERLRRNLSYEDALCATAERYSLSEKAIESILTDFNKAKAARAAYHKTKKKSP
jgi:hypothetical protein